MPKFPTKKNKMKLSVRRILRETNHFILSNPLLILCIFIVNLVFVLIYQAIPRGVENPLCLLLFVALYIFWCAFYRYYYNLRPYVFSKTLLKSLSPSAKGLLLMFLVAVFFAFLPMIPLFLGYDDLYLRIYERYIQAFEGLSPESRTQTSLVDILTIYGVIALLSPILIFKPYIAWISSLRRKNSSFQHAGNKTKGNYWKIFLIALILLYPEAIFTQMDKAWHLNNWLSLPISMILFIYTNILLAKMYDFFYLKN